MQCPKCSQTVDPTKGHYCVNGFAKRLIPSPRKSTENN